MSVFLSLDPALFALQSLVTAEEQIAQALTSLIELSNQVRSHGLQIFMLSDVEEILARDNLFPVANSIGEMLRHFNLSHVYSTEEIRRLMYSLFERSTDLESLSGVTFLVPNSFTSTPDISPRSPRLLEAAALTLIHTALSYRQLDRELVHALIVNQSTPLMQIDAQIVDIDPPLVPDNLAAMHLRETVSTPQSLEALWRTISPFAIWQAATDVAAIALAISLSAQRFRHNNGCSNPKGNCKPFAIGSNFIESLATWQAGGNARYAGTTFETCARLVAQLPKNPRREYHDDDGEHKKRADGATAWRIHITEEHEALRLMVWELPDGTLELANVGSKHELIIF